jgi:hypothetical protein
MLSLEDSDEVKRIVHRLVRDYAFYTVMVIMIFILGVCVGRGGLA